MSTCLGVLTLSWTLALLAQMPGQLPLAPKNIPQFVDPLPHFAGVRVDAKGGGNLVVRMVPHTQVAVSTGTILANGTVGVTPGVGLANLWVYQITGGNYAGGTPPLWPAFTIEASRGNSLSVTYENALSGQTYADVNLLVDQTLHWADPLMTPSANMMLPYEGAPPAVVHLHGGEVASESDGGPDAWFTPGYAEKGPAWAAGADQFYSYPNTQEAATLWYHDHALGVTRLNVYAGMAGFYFLRGPEEEAALLPGWSGDDLVQEVLPPGKSGVNPNLPYLPEIEVAIQDRMFDTNGQLYFPNLPPNPMDHPFWTPEFVGDVITVNGKTWPYLSVAPRKYRFRILNGSNARFYELWLQDLVTGAMGPSIVQIGTDGGLLDAPVTINPTLGQKLLLAPGERADVVIDFSANPGAVWTLRNSGNAPYPKGAPPTGTTTGRIMQFVVNGQMVSAANPSVGGSDKSFVPGSLRSPLVPLTNFAGLTNVPIAVKRQLTLNEVMGMGGPLEVLVNNTKWDGNGHATPGLGETETPTEGTSEVWQIINLTADAHPIHLHLVQFQLVSRQKFNASKYNKVYLPVPGNGPPNPYTTPNADGAVGGNPAITPYLQGPVKPANPNEKGWKDTFIMYPGEVTTVVVRFAPTDLPTTTPVASLTFGFDPSQGPGYVWHCHIIDHEDNEMMRPYVVNPNPSRAALSGGLAAEVEGVALASENSSAPAEFDLAQNYPNPFNPTTEIRFALPEDNHVRLTLYNSLGQEVKTLIDAEAKAGYHTVRLDAASLASGTYFYRIQAGNFVSMKKMLLLK